MARTSHSQADEIFAGVDWGGSFHQLCLVDADGKTLLQKRFEHTVAGVGDLCRALTGRAGVVRVAIERAEGILVEHLTALGVEVFCLSPKISARARERYRLAATKSDAFDAFVLADTLRHEHEHYRPIPHGSDLLMQIRAVIRDRERVVWRQRDIENQLRATLEAYHPAPAHLFSSLDRDITLEFIKRYPTPVQAGRVGASRMAGFLSRQHYSGRTAPELLVERMGPHLLSAGQGTVIGKAFTAVRFAEQLQLLNRHIKDYDIELTRLLAAHSDTKIFGSFPGIGTVIAATLIAGMGEDRTAYPNARTLLAQAGLAPVTRASGRTRQVRFRYAANKRMRHAIDQWMFVVVREDPEWSGRIYETARVAGQGHHRALRGIGARWTRILWRAWQDRAEYNPALHAHRRDALTAAESHEHEAQTAPLKLAS